MAISFEIDWKQAAKELGIKEKQLKPILRQALTDAGKKIKDDFKRPTRTWEHKVDVEVLTEITGYGVELVAGTDDRIFGMLEHGTRGHWVGPKQASALRFLSGYHRKTTPGSLHAGMGGRFGNVVFSRGHWVKGIKPRRWLPIIEQRARKFLDYSVRKYIARWAA